MKVTKIRMKPGCGSSSNLLEIDALYLTGFEKNSSNKPGFYKKEGVYDYLVDNPGTIQVDVSPYPNVIPATGPTPDREKYVKSSPNNTLKDNLLSLERE